MSTSMVQLLVAAGTAIILLLGVLHLAYTFFIRKFNPRDSGLDLLLVSFLTIAVVASARDAPEQIVDLTDTIRIGLVRDTAGQTMIDKYGIHEVQLQPEMTFQSTTGRSTFLGISTQVGTHVDAGAHVEPDGWTIDRIDLQHLIGPGVLVDVRNKTAESPVTPSDLEKYKIDSGDIVLFYFSTDRPEKADRTRNPI